MVASSDGGPVAVLIGTKREREVMVRRLGVRPGQERQGHGGHLLTSLGQKLAVLGPERLVAEVPRALPGLGDFFTAAGWRREAAYTDFRRAPAPSEAVPGEWLVPVTVDELVEHGLLHRRDGVAWEGQLETVRNLGDDLDGVAVASPERIEAYALHRPSADGEGLEIVAAGAAGSEREELFLGLLLRHLAGSGVKLRIPKLAEGELPEGVLAPLGFEVGERHDRYAGVATPA
jgi:hypothetical protein